uniref:PAS domain-containing protein n=1 Tax=Pygocentrus nattereri TaxID=42514 RepID=A0AAR2IQ27_PYGNA
MPSGDSCEDGEENVSPSPRRGAQVDQTSSEPELGPSGSASSAGPLSGSGSGEDEEAEERPRQPGIGESSVTCEESGGEPSGGEQGQEDVEMNSGHDSSSGNDSMGRSRRHSPSANRSPGSSTGSASAKSSKSATGSSSSSIRSAASGQSEQTEQERGHAHREMMQTVQEMKKRLPSEKRSRSKASTVEALNYALKCVKQVQANSEYYKLLMCNGLEERRDATVCTQEQLEGITSEHTLKNTVRSFSVLGILYPLVWICDFRGKDRDGEMRYNPFRITPYLLKVRSVGGEEEQPCCLALVERIISGYEAPRIPTDKRIFTTTHSPGCVFLEVDDRAVPLLGYLPQDLIGTSLLTCIHPEDRMLMLTMHRKVLKYAGQPPFEHSPVRFRSQNGDYVTLDSSWSSFVNPWSRKVAFIIGRHKVRTGPLNEDVFAAQNKVEPLVMHEDVKELQAIIYKLFLQPVHNNGSSGYGSLGSNGSHEHYISVASSSDSNGNLWEDSHREPVTLQQICANVNKVKRGGQQAYLDSRRKLRPVGKVTTETQAPLPRGGQVQSLQASLEESHRKQTHIPSYQQINCVDSIIRYLESCSGPALKRKSETLSIAASSSSSTSEEDKPPPAPLEDVANRDGKHEVILSYVSPPGPTLKAMSVVSSQCSYSSTIVHVPQPESEVTALEDAPMGSESADPAPAPARPALSSSSAAQEEFHIVGLTKEVLSAHTQKEEQEYVDRFRHRILESPFSSYLQQDNGGWNTSHSGKPKHKRPKPQCSSDSDVSRPGMCPPLCSPAPNNSSSESSKPNFISPMLMPVQPPYYPMAAPPGAEQAPSTVPMVLQPEQMQSMQPLVQVMNPFPIVAVILPYPANYVYPQGIPGIQGIGPHPSFHQPPCMSMVDTSPQAGPSGMPPVPNTLLDSPILSPWQGEDLDGAQPTALFSSSRSSSPLQLNLLQEELPKLTEPQSSTGRPESLHEQHAKGVDAPSESGNQDAQSTSSVMLDLLLHEDARSGTGSNASGSGSGESGGSLGSGSGLGSNGTSTSHTGSSNSSKYFASNDSSDTSRKARKSQEAQERTTYEKCVESSLWTMIQHTPEPVMMTYQIHPRDQAQVLKEDREKLLLLQPMQPWFSQEQKEELAEVHSWIHRRTVPEEINTQVRSQPICSMNDCDISLDSTLLSLCRVQVQGQ